MAVNSYKPDEALQELRYQEQILNSLVESQVILQLLVKHDIVTREEVSDMRNTVRNSPKFKPAIEDIEKQKSLYQAAKENPEEYLKAMFKAKVDGKYKAENFED